GPIVHIVERAIAARDMLALFVDVRRVVGFAAARLIRVGACRRLSLNRRGGLRLLLRLRQRWDRGQEHSQSRKDQRSHRSHPSFEPQPPWHAVRPRQTLTASFLVPLYNVPNRRCSGEAYAIVRILAKECVG